MIDEVIGSYRKLDDLPRLSERELEIGRLISEGVSVHEMSKKLGLTEYNIRSRLNDMYAKLGLVGKPNPRVGLAMWMFALGQVPAPAFAHAEVRTLHSKAYRSYHRRSYRRSRDS